MSNHYANAIAVLENFTGGSIAEKMLYEIAKHHPKVVSKAYSVVTGDFKVRVQQECEALIKAEKFIQAIKRYRELTGTGLSEAKKECERIRDNM